MTQEQTISIVTKRDGTTAPYDASKIQRAVEWATKGLNVNASELEASVYRLLLSGMSTQDIQLSLELTASSLISEDCPDARFAAARFLLQRLYKQVNDGAIEYPNWVDYATRAVATSNMSPDLLNNELFDLATINAAIVPDRDFQFDYLGLKTLTDRYFLRDDDENIIELPQQWLMRVSMGKALAETTRAKRTEQALLYYSYTSQLRYMNSTPTLFNSGTTRPQLSSCFGSTWGDDTDLIMDGAKETAHYSKFSGGCSIDVGGIRASGSRIKSTRGKAGGPIPYIKIYNDVLTGWDQSGKRKGSGSVYIEPWHADIFRFLDLKEPGDDRLRAHDVFPANWIPDLFMERVRAGKLWSLFDPKDVPLLHETWGQEFEALYHAAEEQGLYTEQVDANELWILMLTRLYTHGVFWPCFKDTVNRRYVQPEMVHNSNLCTEITLRNDKDTSFVCNLASVNAAHPLHLLKRDAQGKWMWNSDLEATARAMVRDQDSVVTVGMIPHKNGRNFQSQDKAIGIGVMGYTEALYAMGIDYESGEHIEYASEVMRQISLSAIDESANLARELGSYPTFYKSKWAQGILPSDTLHHFKVVEEFGLDLNAPTPFGTMDDLRAKVRGGMRNSTLLAIAPTATIANIVGTTACTELPWERNFVKKNLSGVFNYTAHTLLNNPYGLEFKAANSVDQMWTVMSAAARGIWIDQAQSTNIFVSPTIPHADVGDWLDKIYFAMYDYGNKTSYYLYNQANEDEIKHHNVANSSLAQAPGIAPETADGAACYLRPGDEGFAECEACQ